MTAEYNITIFKNSTWTLPITLRSKGCETGIDLSSATIYGYILDSGSPLVVFTSKAVDLSTGQFELRLTASQTSAISLTNNVGKYRVDITYTGSPALNEDKETVLSGTVTVKED